MQYENTNSIDNQSMNNTIHSPVDDIPKAPKPNNTFKLATIALAIVTLVLGGILTFTIINNNKTTTQANAKLKETEAKVSASEEVIKKYEEATKTKVEEVKNETKEIVKQIVMPTTYDVKFKELTDLIENMHPGSRGFITDGDIFTNKEGTYLFAYLDVSGIVKSTDAIGQEISILATGGSREMYYRSLPSGNWTYAFGGHMIPLCNSLKPEVREIFRTAGRGDKCLTKEDGVDSEDF